MSELLAPAGNKEALIAAIANGCNAVYLGLDKYSARAYADNFNLDNLKEYVDYAHLRNVKVYVTLNTIAYDDELSDLYKTIDNLANIGVDAIIVQDLAILNYATNTYKSLEVHASTQMGIDDYLGAELLKDLGVKRVVLARETPLNKIKEIKTKTNIEVESFIHGALCVSYSGNCFMSSAIGERSGNRGRCAGCCRKLYSLINLEDNKTLKTGYLLSLKDLNVSKHLKDMSFIDSFKIEGRMKENYYVAGVVNHYRKLIDNEKVNNDALDKVFNRTYTKGFIFNEDSKDIANISRPNNNGYLLGKVSKVHNNKVWIKLFKSVSKGDSIRIEEEENINDINLTLTKIFDANFNVIDKGESTIIFYTDKKIKVNSKVYKTKDVLFNESLNLGIKNKEYKKLGIKVNLDIKVDEPILMKVNYEGHTIYQKSEYIVSAAINNGTTKDDIISSISKLNDTPYYIDSININIDNNVFIPVKALNELRRNAIEKLNNARLNHKVRRNKEIFNISPKQYEETTPKISVEVSNEEQYNLVKSLGIEDIYFNNIVRRNNCTYVDDASTVLIGGLSSVRYYKNKPVTLVSDYSLNVTNHFTVGLLSTLGVDRITLSSELNEDQISSLIAQYKETYKTNPNLELIIYGRSTLMHSRYCPLRKLDMCGECKKHKFALKDNFESFPLRFNNDCTINLLNSKTLNLIDEVNNIKGVNYFRLVFTTESVAEIKNIINLTLDKLNNKTNKKAFDGNKNTRGNFKKKLL